MIALPLWQFFILLGLSGVSLTWFFLLPSVRWFLQRRVSRLIDQLNANLDFKLQPFKLSKRQALISALMVDPQILQAAEDWAASENISQARALALVRGYALEIVPSFNAYFYFKIGNWLARSVSQLIYRVRLGRIEEEQLKRINDHSSIVFVLNHRSNMDYILLSYFVSSRTAISYAVGEWARVWPLQGLIRSLGAFFVRRKQHNPLYRKVLERYVQMATEGGVTQAIFLEGKLTRNGLLNPPKLGLLDYMLRNYDPAKNRDILFVPVGINYDRTLEDRSLLAADYNANHPKPGWVKSLTTAFGFLGKALLGRLLGTWYRFGYASVNIGGPVSLQDYLKENNLDLAKLDKDQRIPLVEALAQHLMAAVGRIVPVLPVGLVAQVFLQKGEAGLSLLELKALVFAQVQDYQNRGVHIYLPRQDLDYAIQVGLRMLTLRHFVQEEAGLYRPNPAERPILEYYANALACHEPPGDAKGG